MKRYSALTLAALSALALTIPVSADPGHSTVTVNPQATLAGRGKTGLPLTVRSGFDFTLQGFFIPIGHDASALHFPPVDSADVVFSQEVLDAGSLFMITSWDNEGGVGVLGGILFPGMNAGPDQLIASLPFGTDAAAAPGDYTLDLGAQGGALLVDDTAAGHVPTATNGLVRIVSFGLRGDANGDGKYTLGDVISLVNHIFNKPGAPPGGWLEGDSPEEKLYHGDVNSNGSVTLSDTIHLVNYIFNKPGGPWLPVSDMP